MNEIKNKRTLQLAYMGMFTALLVLCAWISIPLTIPVTLQTFAVFIAIAMLGMKKSLAVLMVYIILGVAGLPVFAGFKGGIGVLLGPTGGYILGFFLTVLITGGILRIFGRKLPIMIMAMILGLVACYGFGTVWFLYIYGQNGESVGVISALTWCVFPYVIPDLCKIALAVFLDKRLARYIAI